MRDHPHGALDGERRLLATELVLEGEPGADWKISGRAVPIDRPYRPSLSTVRPRARVQSATVIPAGIGDELGEVDELGRVRVRFAWDRYGQSSAWVRVSQEWAGAGFGMIQLPRPGHEVLVDFLEGDPEQPVIVGSVFDAANPVPDMLPAHQTRSAWKSSSLAGGFNEILYEDKASEELVYAQAETDARRLVKHDDTQTIVHDRRKDVGGSELETTNGKRIQETKKDRVEITRGTETVVADKTRGTRVKMSSEELAYQGRLDTVGGDRHDFTAGNRRESTAKNASLTVGGSRQTRAGGIAGFTVTSAVNETVLGDYSVTATAPDGWIHYISGAPMMVVESDTDVTFQGAGGFVKVDASGVTIVGTTVVINEGGSPGSLKGPGPIKPALPHVVSIADPPMPPDVPERGPPPQ
jgi:type VI secretion system secreted protein VgrG